MAAKTFSEKFEEALDAKRASDPRYGLRTLAREIAQGDDAKAEVIRRRLYKYRPPKNGSGGAAISPTPPTRHEIEDAMGIERDSLKPDEDLATASMDALLRDLAPMRALARLADMVERGELVQL